MGTIERFEDIEAWRTARELTRRIYHFTSDGPCARDFGFKDQIRRASVSAMSNIAEGFERDGTAEFLQFLSIAKGSAGEVRSQLYVAIDQGYVQPSDFDELYELSATVSRLIRGFMRYLHTVDHRGTKFLTNPPSPQPET